MPITQNLNTHWNRYRTILSITLAFLTMVLWQKPAGATHAMGAEISYKHDTGLTYKFTVLMYRDCRGVSLSNPSPQTRIRCKTGGSSFSVSLTLESIRDITPVCDTVAKPCDPANMYNTGKGIEVHEFTTTIDFNQSTFRELRNCCRVIFETSQCCRNGAITTGAANQNFYTFCELDLCLDKPNNSADFGNEPVLFLCCNQPFYFYPGGSDLIDHDSISYNLVNPLKAYGNKISYTSPFSSQEPFTYYDPSNTGRVEPDSNPPEGFFFDPENGGVIFTPTKCDEVTVMVLEMREWRKDSNGVYQDIGVTQRDINYWVESCAGNNPPTLSGPYEYNVKLGDTLVIDITTDDKTYVPPPPDTIPDPDTVTLNVLNLFSDASLTILDTNAIHPKARFRWIVKDEGRMSYFFTLEARDNACPFNSTISRAYTINIIPDSTNDTTNTIADLNLPQVTVKPNPNNGLFVLSAEHGYLKVTRITDVTGKAIRFKNRELGGSATEFSMPDASPGVYFVEIRQSGFVSVLRLIIQ